MLNRIGLSIYMCWNMYWNKIFNSIIGFEYPCYPPFGGWERYWLLSISLVGVDGNVVGIEAMGFGGRELARFDSRTVIVLGLHGQQGERCAGTADKVADWDRSCLLVDASWRWAGEMAFARIGIGSSDCRHLKKL